MKDIASLFVSVVSLFNLTLDFRFFGFGK